MMRLRANKKNGVGKWELKIKRDKEEKKVKGNKIKVNKLTDVKTRNERKE